MTLFYVKISSPEPIFEFGFAQFTCPFNTLEAPLDLHSIHFRLIHLVYFEASMNNILREDLKAGTLNT